MALVTLPRQYLADANGRPKVGAKAYFYQAGTTTEITVYQDPDFSTAHTNPVETTSAGIFPAIYVNPGVNPTYKIVITDAADVTIYTEDNIPAQDEIIFLQAGDSAIARSVSSKLRESVSVTDFGALVDGVTDDGAAWAAAISYLIGIGGGDLIIPKGLHYLATQIRVTGVINGIRFRGDGADASTVINGITGAAAQSLFLIDANGNYFVFEGFEIRGNGLTGASGNGHAIALINPGVTLSPQTVAMRDMLVRGHRGTGRDETGASIPSCGVFAYKSSGYTFDNVTIYQCAQGLRMKQMQDCSWHGGTIDACDNNCIWLEESFAVSFHGGTYQSAGAGGATDGVLYLTDCESVSFHGCEMKNGYPYLVNCQGAAQVNHNVAFRDMAFAQLDPALGHTAVRLNNASMNFTFDGCRFDFVNTITDAKAIEVIQSVGGFNCTGLRVIGNSFKAGTGGTIAACVHLNVTTNNVHAPVIESNEFGWQDSTGSATAITDAILLDGNVKGCVIRNNTFIAATNVTITDAIHIASSGVNGLRVLYNEYGGLGTITNQVNNAAAVQYTRKEQAFEPRGTATLLSGTTSIAVNHGLGFTPALSMLSVTPHGSLGSASRFWISGATSTQFTINVDINPGANVTFGWQAHV